MKKIVVFMLVACLLCCVIFTSCGNKEQGEDPTTEPTVTTETLDNGTTTTETSDNGTTTTTDDNTTTTAPDTGDDTPANDLYQADGWTKNY